MSPKKALKKFKQMKVPGSPPVSAQCLQPLSRKDIKAKVSIRQSMDERTHKQTYKNQRMSIMSDLNPTIGVDEEMELKNLLTSIGIKNWQKFHWFYTPFAFSSFSLTNVLQKSLRIDILEDSLKKLDRFNISQTKNHLHLSWELLELKFIYSPNSMFRYCSGVVPGFSELEQANFSVSYSQDPLQNVVFWCILPSIRTP